MPVQEFVTGPVIRYQLCLGHKVDGNHGFGHDYALDRSAIGAGTTYQNQQ